MERKKDYINNTSKDIHRHSSDYDGNFCNIIPFNDFNGSKWLHTLPDSITAAACFFTFLPKDF